MEFPTPPQGGFSQRIANNANSMFYSDPLRPGLGYSSQAPMSVSNGATNSNRFSSYPSAGMVPNLLQASAFPVGSLVNGLGNIITTSMNNAQENRKLDFMKQMREQDFKAAQQMGLAHPSMMQNLQQASINRLGNRSFTTVPRTINRFSPYGY